MKMQAPSKGAKQKQGLRWGSFLQQAVAGVESKLDTLLTEGDVAPGQSSALSDGAGSQQPALKQGISGSSSSTPIVSDEAPSPTSLSRSSSKNIRDRLNKAVAKDPVGRARASSSPYGIVETSAMASKQLDGVKEQGQDDPESQSTTPQKTFSSRSASHSRQLSLAANVGGQMGAEHSNVDNGISLRFSQSSTRPSMESDHGETGSGIINSTMDSNDPDGLEIERMRRDYELGELRRQEEVHAHMERIDALQAKLQYLAREAAEAARAMANASSPGSVEKKLAEKDEQIALLMEEGQTLSKTELKNMNTIKMLRGKRVEDEKAANDIKKKLEKSERERINLQEKCQRLQAAEKAANERLRSIAKSEKELESLRLEQTTSKSTIAQLQAQLNETSSKISEAEKRAQAEALRVEQETTKELRDDLSNMKIEKELSEERLRAEIRQSKEAAQRDREHAQSTEMELRTEHSILESKLEALRSKAEEVSAGVTTDAQAKLLRQMENMQTQYAVANENWHGIESTMSTRITKLQKERDDLSVRETELKKKARQLNTQSKRLQEELDTSHSLHQDLEKDLAELREQTQKLQKRADEAEGSLAQARSDLDNERQIWESRLHQRIEEERLRTHEDGFQSPYRNGRIDSPTTFSRKGSNFETSNLQPRRTFGRSSTAEIPTHHERPQSRRASAHPNSRTPDLGTPQRQDSLPSMNNIPFDTVTETPSINAADEDYFEGVTSPHSPHRTINDLISVSTAAAGPSVQLVERMSAAVRRLESEKATAKEELARLSAQRDEAREEVVRLIRELEDVRGADEKCKQLQSELDNLNARYQTTLEMLGEKSEKVEELQADIVDVKKIYRELLDRTMK